MSIQYFDIYKTSIPPLFEARRNVGITKLLSRRSVMVKDIVFIAGDLGQTEEYARQLVNRTLASLESVINIVAVKIDHEKTIPLTTFDFHCTILVKFEGGAVVRAEARDCDDILAVYGALEKIIDQIPLKSVKVGNACPEE